MVFLLEMMTFVPLIILVVLMKEIVMLTVNAKQVFSVILIIVVQNILGWPLMSIAVLEDVSFI